LTILFTADWHIKLAQKNVPVPWALNRYHEFFKQVHAIKCDKHIIGGDLFDRIPSMEELELYYEFILGVNVPTIIFDGNHEATKKGVTFLKSLKKVTKALNPLVEIIDECYIDENEKFNILPYCKLKASKAFDFLRYDWPLFTHVRGEIPPHVKAEIDLELLSRFPIVYAGDLHSHSNCQRNIIYPGSPLTTTFHRSRVDTGYILIEEDWSWTWHPFKLPQLIRKTVQDPGDMIATDYDHTVYELEGDLVDLANVKNSDLLDKKVIKRSTETALILTPEMTISEELAEYLLFILELDEDKVSTIMGIFHDYT